MMHIFRKLSIYYVMILQFPKGRPLIALFAKTDLKRQNRWMYKATILQSCIDHPTTEKSFVTSLSRFFKKRIANQNIFFTINHFAIHTVLPQSLRIVSAFLDCSRIDRNWLCLYWVRHVGKQCQFSWVVLFVTIVICILHHDHENLATINNVLQNLTINKILSQSNWIEEYNNPTILVQSSTIVKHIYLDCDCPNPIVIVTIQIQSTPSKYNWHNPNTIDIFQLQSTQLFLAQLFGTIGGV